jgi:hypothetical protein
MSAPISTAITPKDNPAASGKAVASGAIASGTNAGSAEPSSACGKAGSKSAGSDKRPCRACRRQSEIRIINEAGTALTFQLQTPSTNRVITITALCDASSSTNTRHITRQQHEYAPDFAQPAARPDVSPRTKAKRATVEMLFAHLRHILRSGASAPRWLAACGPNLDLLLSPRASENLQSSDPRPPKRGSQHNLPPAKHPSNAPTSISV